MIHTVTPREANALIAHGDFDVVDVREAPEWSKGHIPNARLVPFEALKRDPRTALPRDGVLFVCARGRRSLTAAQVAETVGLTNVYSVDGGTSAWAAAGLPLVHG